MKAIIGILTAQHYDARRRGVLRTWGRDIAADPDLDFVFLVGRPALSTASRVGNTLYLPCPDDYDSLPQKTREFCRWLISFEPGSWDIAMKVDDDTYLQVDRLKSFLEHATTVDTAIFGAADGDHFHGGAGYTILPAAATAMVEYMTRPTGLEDWHARDAIHAAGMQWKNEPRFCFDKKRLPMPANEQITAHYCSPIRMRLLWDDFQMGRNIAIDRAVPKVLHHIWIGGDLPLAKQRYRQSWIDQHRGWEHRLWTASDLAELTFINSTQYSTATTPAQKSHIARYEILNMFGGVYVDCDVECFRSIDGFRNSVGFAAAEDDDRIGNAVIGCRANDPLMQCIINAVPDSFGQHNGNVAEETGSGLFTRAFFADDHDWTLHSWQTFYPRHWSGRANGPIDRAYCQHLWDASWK